LIHPQNCFTQKSRKDGFLAGRGLTGALQCSTQGDHSTPTSAQSIAEVGGCCMHQGAYFVKM
jgi:hypothetical protein